MMMLFNAASCWEDYYLNISYVSGVTEVPDDIPDETLYLTLNHSRITRLEKDSFKNLSVCKYMALNNIIMMNTPDVLPTKIKIEVGGKPLKLDRKMCCLFRDRKPKLTFDIYVNCEEKGKKYL